MYLLYFVCILAWIITTVYQVRINNSNIDYMILYLTLFVMFSSDVYFGFLDHILLLENQ